MYNPTKWQKFRDMVRYICCRHKHTEIRTVRAGSDDDEMQVIGRFRFCLDCNNNMGWIYAPKDTPQ